MTAHLINLPRAAAPGGGIGPRHKGLSLHGRPVALGKRRGN